MSLIYPMAALVAFTLLFSSFMLFTRINAVRKGQMSGKYFKTFTDGAPTELVLKVQRHYINLFELPVVFYATILLAIMTGVTSQSAALFAWSFVLARVVHAIIHVGSNKIYPRMTAFLAGWIGIIGLWIEILNVIK